MSEIRVHHNKEQDAFELQINDRPDKLIAAIFHRERNKQRLNLHEAEIYADLFAAAPETKKQRDALLDALKAIANGNSASCLAQYCIDHQIDLTGVYINSTICKMIAKAAIELAEKEG